MEIRASSLGKTFVIAGLLLPFVGLLFLGSHDRLVPCLSLVGSAFFCVMGWLVGTEQLANNSLAGKIGALMISISALSFTIAILGPWYSETAELIHELKLISHYHYTGEPRSGEIVPLKTRLFVYPFAWVSFPSAIFGFGLLFFGLVLKFCWNYVGSRLKGRQLTFKKRFTFSFTLLLIGISLLLLGNIWHGYTNAYAEFMTGKLKVPATYGIHTLEGHSIRKEEVAKYPMHCDFLFRPWFDCRLESNISVPSSNNVTLSVFVGDSNELTFNLTSNEIRYSQNLHSTIPYTFQIRNTINQSVTVVISTTISGTTSQKVMLSGATLTIASSIVTFILIRNELKLSNEKSEEANNKSE